MAKAFFRHLRGELNGYYITNLFNTLNKSTEDMKLFLMNTKNEQFRLGFIRSKALYGLGKFAGIFLPRVSISDSLSSLHMTDSHEVDNVEYSERGLFETDMELFRFFHTSQQEYSDDINTLATSELKSSMIGEEQVIGYISSDNQDVLDDEGNIRPEAILASPPADTAYSEYYGDKFMYLSEAIPVYTNINEELYIELYKSLQIVRYNGASLKSLCDIISVLCPDGLVMIDHLDVGVDGKHINVYYNYDPDIETVSYKQQRVTLLLFLIQEKFKQVAMIEDI